MHRLCDPRPLASASWDGARNLGTTSSQEVVTDSRTGHYEARPLRGRLHAVLLRPVPPECSWLRGVRILELQVLEPKGGSAMPAHLVVLCKSLELFCYLVLVLYAGWRTAKTTKLKKAKSFVLF